MNTGPEGLKIVDMHEGHIAALVSLEKLCFSRPWSYAALMEELWNPNAAFFVAELSGMPVAYAGMVAVLDEGYISNIAVQPELRRRGIATALLERLCDYAVCNGLGMLTLEVRVSNLNSIRIYNRAGFISMGVRPRFYESPDEDAVIMTKFFEKTTETEVQI
jgi:ribosomal-protein-alanine N-acetyltransferase